MQKIGDVQFLYSASDLVHFLSCHHSTVLDIKSFSEDMEKAKESANNKLLQKKGFEHEAAYLAKLRQEGKRIVEIPKEPKLPERVEMTRQALQSGADVVYQGAFFKEMWRGDADFLLKVDMPSALGDLSYEILDTKLSRHGEPKHIIQLPNGRGHCSSASRKTGHHEQNITLRHLYPQIFGRRTGAEF